MAHFAKIKLGATLTGWSSGITEEVTGRLVSQMEDKVYLLTSDGSIHVCLLHTIKIPGGTGIEWEERGEAISPRGAVWQAILESGIDPDTMEALSDAYRQEFNANRE